MIISDNSIKPCPACLKRHYLAHADELPAGTILDYVYECSDCHTCWHVTGTRSASTSTPERKRYDP